MTMDEPRASTSRLATIDAALARVLRWATMACLVALFFLLGGVVAVRFVPVTSLAWSDEIIELAFAWLVFLGTALLWRDRSHFRVDLIPNWLAGSRAGRVLEGLLGLLALGFLILFTYESWILTRAASDRSPSLELPRILWYIVMPISGLIMLAYTARDLWRHLRAPVPQSPASPPTGA
jgi:TRAP-type C4-dicarboxylate transport system permease small subunit